VREAAGLCANLVDMDNQVNPFSPDFGAVPASLVGRNDEFSDIYAGLAAGPRDKRFTTLLLGVRGSGKTAMLTEVEHWAESNGWIVLSVDGHGSGLLHRLSDDIGKASRKYQTPGLGNLSSPSSKERRRGINLGPYHQEWADTEQFDPSVDMGLRERLTLMAQAAQDAGSGVLITVDELHVSDKDEARRLGNDLQHITKRGQLPVAFVGAGLPEMKYTLLDGKKNTFLRRINQCDLMPLSYTDALRGIKAPTEESGGSITKEALRLAASSVDGSPYKLQVIGHAAWDTANAPANEIDESSVELAVESADAIMLRDISDPAFYDLSNSEQEYLAALVSLGERGTTRVIAQMIGASERDTRRIARRLDLSGYINRHDRSPPTLTNLVPRAVIIKESDLDIGEVQLVPAIGSTFSRSSPTSQAPVTRRRCREWMPRSAAYCVLPAGHSGRCRSK